MNRTVLILSLIMGAVVLASNYLVQFPIHYYGLSEILTYGAFTYPIAFLIKDNNRTVLFIGIEYTEIKRF